MQLETLVSRQNRDGGWPYVRGVSWTEPTAYAVLALLAAGEREPARRGIEWLRASQRRDGGWAPQAAVDQSAWVTALVLLTPVDQLGKPAHDRAADWLMGAMGEDFTLAHRVRAWLFGGSLDLKKQSPGWPWVPGTAAWVGPTSVAILALEKRQRLQPSAAIQARLDSGRQFLLDRMCKEGGWNHGSTHVLGYDAPPYPETTGMALAGLRGVRSPKVDRGIEVARNFLKECRSADARNWLRLGLTAQAQPVLGEGSVPPPCRTLSESALDLLIATGDAGRNLLLS